MKIAQVIQSLEKLAPPALQEEYDNAGLITGNLHDECSGVMVSLDATEEVILEAIEKNCNLVVSHHPILFRGLKRITGRNYVERALILAIRHNIALYAIHTNLDNVMHGVCGRMADRLSLSNRRVLAPGKDKLEKLVVFVPHAHRDNLLNALFAAGAGGIGQYAECSFMLEGNGTFKGSEQSNPFVGEKGSRHTEPETRIEVIYPGWLRGRVLAGMRSAHPYEVIAHDIYSLKNDYVETGSGLMGDLPADMDTGDFLRLLKQAFGLQVIRFAGKKSGKIRKLALCGGSGSFLLSAAKAAGADAFVTADMKYHEFFDAENSLLLADIGHFESEQFTIDLLHEFLQENFPNFAVLKTGVNTNPVSYLF